MYVACSAPTFEKGGLSICVRRQACSMPSTVRQTNMSATQLSGRGTRSEYAVVSIIALSCSVWIVCCFQLTHACSHQIQYFFIKFNVSTFFYHKYRYKFKTKNNFTKNKIKKIYCYCQRYGVKVSLYLVCKGSIQMDLFPGSPSPHLPDIWSRCLILSLLSQKQHESHSLPLMNKFYKSMRSP